MSQIWTVVTAATAGVLLPKVLPALVLPSHLPAPVRAWMRYLPTATLGAFSAVTTAGFAAHSTRPWLLVLTMALVAAVALVSRRTFLTLFGGCVLVGILQGTGLT